MKVIMQWTLTHLNAKTAKVVRLKTKDVKTERSLIENAVERKSEKEKKRH